VRCLTLEAAAQRPSRSRLGPVNGRRGEMQVSMVDVTAGQGAGAPGTVSVAQRNRAILKRGDIALALGILTILVVLILPLPRSCSTCSWRSRSRCRS